ncbi:MAG: DUF721 domain-containing protein [Gemmatimonadota bacterium]
MSAEEGRRRGRRRKRGTERIDPEPVAGIVGQVLQRLGVVEKVERAAAVAEWDRIVGPHIARVTGARRVRGHTLFVEVEGAVWLTELNMMRHELLRRLNAGRKRGRIERIVFVQSGGREDEGRARWRGRGSG